jgi:alanine racemase
VRQATVCIDSQALQYNFNRVKELAPNSKIVSMVKANAYGHGIKECLKPLSQTDVFGVACLEEALTIRELGFQNDLILIEGVFSEIEMQTVIDQRIEIIIHHQQQLDWILKYKDRFNALNLKVWVKLNSGMNRLGFKIDAIKDVIHLLKSNGFTCVLAMHFANADSDHSLNQQQIDQFLEIKNDCSPILASCCNSAAIYKYPELHFDYVRPGIMLYGATPFSDRSVHDLDLKPVMDFTASIIAINEIKAGEFVGYGSTFEAQRNMTLAIVSIGYGDGYPRAFSTTNYVAIHDMKAPIIGRVAMDMIAIDITGLDVTLGTEVELWGKNQLVDDVANANQTIGYELLCRLSQRPKRISK